MKFNWQMYSKVKVFRDCHWQRCFENGWKNYLSKYVLTHICIVNDISDIRLKFDVTWHLRIHVLKMSVFCTMYCESKIPIMKALNGQLSFFLWQSYMFVIKLWYGVVFTYWDMSIVCLMSILRWTEKTTILLLEQARLRYIVGKILCM